jgi:hypothetical protein
LGRIHQASGDDGHKDDTPVPSAPAPRAVANSLASIHGSHVRMTTLESKATIMPPVAGTDNNRSPGDVFGHCGFRVSRCARFPSRITRQGDILARPIMSNFEQQKTKFRTQAGFIAALDQSGGSTPKALRLYGIQESAWSGDAEMMGLIHAMRTRIITSLCTNSRWM